MLDEMCFDVAPANIAACVPPAPDGTLVTPWCYLLKGHEGPHRCGEHRWTDPAPAAPVVGEAALDVDALVARRREEVMLALEEGASMEQPELRDDLDLCATIESLQRELSEATARLGASEQRRTEAEGVLRWFSLEVAKAAGCDGVVTGEQIIARIAQLFAEAKRA